MADIILIRVEREKLDSWSLVLDSQGIPYRVVRRPDGWSVAVRSDHVERVVSLIEQYESENPPETSEVARLAGKGRTYFGLYVAVGLALFFLVTGPSSSTSHWFTEGTAVSELIRQGEIWRGVTALTLHADFAHILSNTLSTALFLTAVAQVLGPGLGASLVLASGALGNVVNAWVQGPGHRSVGASTAIFGAVGILAGVALARRQRLGSWRGAWAPVVAGLALLGLLGTGESTDIAAHLFGFTVGLGLGIVAGFGIESPPRRSVQWLLAALSGAVLILSWLIART